MSGIRTFIGIPLPSEVLDAFVCACDAVKAGDASWRDEKWVPRQNMHVTLKFLGDIAEEDLTRLAGAVAEAAAACAPFDLADAGFRAVPNTRRARMLWGTFFDPEGHCAALAAELNRVCLAFGVPPEERTFKPHATLVRARRDKYVAEPAIEAGQDCVSRVTDAVSVRSITLFSSRLTSREPIYEILREYRLGAA